MYDNDDDEYDISWMVKFAVALLACIVALPGLFILLAWLTMPGV